MFSVIGILPKYILWLYFSQVSDIQTITNDMVKLLQWHIQWKNKQVCVCVVCAWVERLDVAWQVTRFELLEQMLTLISRSVVRKKQFDTLGVVND